MSRLLTSQINRAIFRVMGLDKFQLQEFEDHFHEITFEWDLELMEKYDDFKYLSEDMFRKAVAQANMHEVDYPYPQPPKVNALPAIDSPLNPNEKIALDLPMNIFFELDKRPINVFKVSGLMPMMSHFIEEYEALERKKQSEKMVAERKQKQAEKAKRKAEAKAAKANKVSQPALSKEELKKAQESANAVAKAYEKLGLNPDGSSAKSNERDTEVSKSIASADESAKLNDNAAVNESNVEGSEDVTEAPSMMDVVCEKMAALHRYTGRKIYIRALPSRSGDLRSIEWCMSCLHQHLIVPENGITDLMRDLIVYKWFNNLEPEQRALFPHDLSCADLHKSLILSDVIIFHDAKMTLWYALKNNICGSDIQGFGVDIDPPFKRNFAVSIKHIFSGKLADHPTVATYRKMIAHKRLNNVVTDVHYCQNDNLSPSSQEETSEQLSFINDAFMIFDMEINGVQGSIEVLVKDQLYDNLDAVAARLKDLKDNDLSDFDGLNSDIIELIAEPIVEMKNDHEARRRNKDAEFAGLIFKDGIHRQEFTVEKLRKSYPLKIDRIVITSDEEIKFLINTNLFAYIEKPSANSANGGDVLSLIHADCIMVTFIQGDNGLELSSIDITDGIQIPYGAHKNEDINLYTDGVLENLVNDKHNYIDEDWDKEWNEAVAERRQKDQDMNDRMVATNQEWLEFRQNSQAKTMKTRARLRKERKKKR